MSMGIDKIVWLRCYGGFYTGVICQGHQKVVAKEIVGLYILKIGRARTIWGKVLYKLRVYFGGMVSMNKILLDYGHCI